MRVLVLNAGSSSVKLRVVEPDDTVAHRADLDAPHGQPAEGALARTVVGLVREAGGVDAVGHRVVHGGAEFTGPTVIDPDVLERIDRLGVLAPLHQPPAVAGIRSVREALPDVPAVACFDTAFHATMPDAARTYAIPARWRSELGVRRYGFHGLAHDWASGRAAHLVGRPLDELRVVVAHLGSGASACAVRGGRSVDTTMGFTPTAGLVMATRSGDLDPSAVAWLTLRAGVPTAEVDHALDHASGLLALAGDPDMRRVLEPPPPGTSGPGSRSRSGCTGPAASSPPWLPPRAGSTSWRSAGASGRTPPTCADASSRAWASWGSPSTPRPTRPRWAVRRATCPPPEPWHARSSSTRARTSSSPARCGRCSRAGDQRAAQRTMRAVKPSTAWKKSICQVSCRATHSPLPEPGRGAR